MSRKSRGIAGERELVHKFWGNGWACIRVAGSGSSRYPCPDLLAGNNLRKLAIECKLVKSMDKYLSDEELKQLKTFAEKFGAESWLAIKFKGFDWLFINLEDLKETNKGAGISFEAAKLKGLSFDELIEK
ncbi:MAG: Holliday junction resolvase Hjc [Nanoarchaeota archaeon]|nr:Holliday junction resolvase Hjc [Nanoarchaeota archaeon]